MASIDGIAGIGIALGILQTVEVQLSDRFQRGKDFLQGLVHEGTGIGVFQLPVVADDVMLPVRQEVRDSVST